MSDGGVVPQCAHDPGLPLRGAGSGVEGRSPSDDRATRSRIWLSSFSSFNFRLKRALRIVPISRESQQDAAQHFDDVVLDIETARAKERQSPHIRRQWPTNRFDDATCVACDWRVVCPAHPDVTTSLTTESA